MNKDSYEYNYDCPLCGWNENRYSTIQYFPQSEPNQYEREKLEEHLREQHLDELIQNYHRRTISNIVVKDFIKAIKAKNKENSKLFRKKGNFIMRLLNKV